MAARLILTVEVEQDIAEVYAWYEGRRRGLGEESLGSLEASLEAIRRYPGLLAPVHENYRRALVIFYEFQKETVTVFYIVHAARDPAKWRERIS